MNTPIENPFRPGAGHKPPYLAGRTSEQDEIRKYLSQDIILQNVILTGLRGVGKTVLLDTFKSIALQGGWLWASENLSESASITEGTLATRIITDIAVVTSAFMTVKQIQPLGFVPSKQVPQQPLDFEMLKAKFEATPGLVSDKLKAVLEFVWSIISSVETGKIKGIVFAYDEAQNVVDHPKQQQFPLALLLDVFQSLQRKGIPFMLILTGLPTLFPKLVEARTYAERMFHVMFLKQLDESASREAIEKQIGRASCRERV